MRCISRGSVKPRSCPADLGEVAASYAAPSARGKSEASIGEYRRDPIHLIGSEVAAVRSSAMISSRQSDAVLGEGRHAIPPHLSDAIDVQAGVAGEMVNRELEQPLHDHIKGQHVSKLPIPTETCRADLGPC